MFTTIFLQTAGGSSLTSMLPFLLMFVVIYLFMIRPQMKRAKNEKAFQASIAKGNKVITTTTSEGCTTQIMLLGNFGSNLSKARYMTILLLFSLEIMVSGYLMKNSQIEKTKSQHL